MTQQAFKEKVNINSANCIFFILVLAREGVGPNKNQARVGTTWHDVGTTWHELARLGTTWHEVGTTWHELVAATAYLT